MRDWGNNLPLSNSRAGYRVNEGIPTPSQRQVATVRRESKLMIFCSYRSNKRFRTRDARGAWGCEAM